MMEYIDIIAVWTNIQGNGRGSKTSLVLEYIMYIDIIAVSLKYLVMHRRGFKDTTFVKLNLKFGILFTQNLFDVILVMNDSKHITRLLHNLQSIF